MAGERSSYANPSNHETSWAGSLDGRGAGDRDEPYNGFQRYYFSDLQWAKLLILKRKLEEGAFREDTTALHMS